MLFEPRDVFASLGGHASVRPFTMIVGPSSLASFDVHALCPLLFDEHPHESVPVGRVANARRVVAPFARVEVVSCRRVHRVSPTRWLQSFEGRPSGRVLAGDERPGERAQLGEPNRLVLQLLDGSR